MVWCFTFQGDGSSRADFNLIAVWACAHSNRRLSYVGQVYRAVGLYADFMAETDTLMIGDLNSNKIWDGVPRVGNHSDVVARLAAHGLVSVYHEPQGAETRPTYYQYRHESMPYHLDYCTHNHGCLVWAFCLRNQPLLGQNRRRLHVDRGLFDWP